MFLPVRFFSFSCSTRFSRSQRFEKGFGNYRKSFSMPENKQGYFQVVNKPSEGVTGFKAYVLNFSSAKSLWKHDKTCKLTLGIKRKLENIKTRWWMHKSIDRFAVVGAIIEICFSRLVPSLQARHLLWNFFFGFQIEGMKKAKTQKTFS